MSSYNNLHLNPIKGCQIINKKSRVKNSTHGHDWKYCRVDISTTGYNTGQETVFTRIYY